MASKTGKGQHTAMPEGKVSIKYVKAARMWCKTLFDYSGRGLPIQKQEWTDKKPEQ